MGNGADRGARPRAGARVRGRRRGTGRGPGPEAAGGLGCGRLARAGHPDAARLQGHGRGTYPVFPVAGARPSRAGGRAGLCAARADRPGRHPCPGRGPPLGVRPVSDDRREVRDPRLTAGLSIRPRRGRGRAGRVVRGVHDVLAGSGRGAGLLRARRDAPGSPPAGPREGGQRVRVATAARRGCARCNGLRGPHEPRFERALPVGRLPADRGPPEIRGARLQSIR